MKNVCEVLLASAQFLQGKGIARARFVAEELLAFVLQCKRLDLYLQFDRPLQEEELGLLRPHLRRASRGEPIDYILGAVSFCGMPFKVNPDVLIPRPETEIFVDLICKELRKAPLEGKEAWDVCAGSGCMGISLKKLCPELRVTLSDLSESALEIAKQNAEQNQIQVECLCGNLLEPFEGRKVDFIVCNPPYVSEGDYSKLDASVRGFEPKMALVGGEDGLLFYRLLKEKLPSFLRSGAKIFFEIGAGQGDALIHLYSDPRWTLRRVERDWSGHDRFFFLEFDSVVL